MKKAKKIATYLIVVMMCSIFMLGNSQKVNAATGDKYRTYWYEDKAHGYCSNITLGATGDSVTGKIYGKWWDSSYAHWPNAFTKETPWHYNVGAYGYVKGTYTIYSSLITQWASIAFQEITNTITITF